MGGVPPKEGRGERPGWVVKCRGGNPNQKRGEVLGIRTQHNGEGKRE